MSEQRWRKSSRSNSGSNCVELREDQLAVRDSKNPDGPALVFTSKGSLISLLDWIKSS